MPIGINAKYALVCSDFGIHYKDRVRAQESQRLKKG